MPDKKIKDLASGDRCSGIMKGEGKTDSEMLTYSSR
jgi:hypothetical protein